MVVGPHPDSDELTVLAGQENNLSLPPRSLAYSIETAENGAPGSPTRASLRLRSRSYPGPRRRRGEVGARGGRGVSVIGARPVSGVGQGDKREFSRGGNLGADAQEGQILGVRPEKESDGLWTWSLPDKGFEGGQAPTAGNVGRLGKVASAEPDKPAYLRERVQGGQDVQAGNERRCKLGLQGGVGCYLCDPRHPYRLKQGGAA